MNWADLCRTQKSYTSLRLVGDQCYTSLRPVLHQSETSLRPVWDQSFRTIAVTHFIYFIHLLQGKGIPSTALEMFHNLSGNKNRNDGADMF